ncbi:peptidase, M42 (glutamyl aminopeptidase) family [Streptococcus pneumoniae]|nr:peptidase, M42 (glutamyl aminopeptidase) family [Streptococcus pneumoniae]
MDRIGGFPWNMIEGENCTIHVASTGEKVSGTILIHQTSCHVYKDAGTAERTQDNMEVRLDAKVTSEKETRALGIEVGDFISFDPRTVVTETGFIKSRHLDDKALAKEQDIPFKLDIYPFYGSDASAAMSAGAEVKHALLGAGIESSHSYERTHIDSVIATERMVDAYLKSTLVD